MSYLATAGVLMYASSIGIYVVFAITYLCRPRFMPYHQVIVGTDWRELDAGVRTMTLALMRVVGSLFLFWAIASAVSLYLLWTRATSAFDLMLFQSLYSACLVLLLVVLVRVRINTGATPPIASCLVALTLSLAAFACLLPYWD